MAEMDEYTKFEMLDFPNTDLCVPGLAADFERFVKESAGLPPERLAEKVAPRAKPAEPALRDVTEGDLPALVELDKLSFPDDPYDLQTMRERLGEGGGFLVEDGGKPVAYALHRPVVSRPDYRYVASLATHPEHRRKGHASRLLEAVKKLGKGLTLDVAADNAAAQALYKKHGFKTETKFTEDDGYARPAYHMSVKLALDLSELRTAAREVDPEPTDAQKEAGNYKKGHVRWKGLPITIETAKGQYRRGKGKDGKPWQTLMKDHYGYIKRTESEADGDHVDVFVCEDDLDSEIVFVVNQNKPDGTFDEHKVVLGCKSKEQARKTYLRNYDSGWNGLGSIAPVTVDWFKWWVKHSDTSKPLENFLDYAQRTTGKAASDLDALEAMEAREKLPYRDRAEMYAMKDGKVFGSVYPDSGAFGVFGGGIDPGENPLTAAAREFQEESGWKVKNPRLLPFDPHLAEWTPPFASPKQAERAKQYRGSRTYYVLGDLDEQIPDAKVDELGRKDVRLYDLEDALKLANPNNDSAGLAAANARRVEILKHLKSLVRPTPNPKSAFDEYVPHLLLVKRAKDDDKAPFTIAVDLDGTLAEKEEPFNSKTIGKPRERAVFWLRLFHAAGARIIIFTVRGNDSLVKKWLEEHDLPYDYVNENPDQPPDSSGKVIADAYWDDRAYNAVDPDEFGPAILSKVVAHGREEEGEKEEPDAGEEPTPAPAHLSISVSKTMILAAPEILEALEFSHGQGCEE